MRIWGEVGFLYIKERGRRRNIRLYSDFGCLVFRVGRINICCLGFSLWCFVTAV